MVDSWPRTAATITLTRFASFIRFCSGRQGPWVALALIALALSYQPAAAEEPSPFFTWSPPSPMTNETVTFTSDLTGVSLSWALDPDLVCNDGTGPTVQRSFPLAGSYWIRLCVTDGTQTWHNTRLITISNQPPVAAFTYSPATPVTGEQIAFTSTSADPDGPIMSQAWDLDADGAFDDATGPTAGWTFAEAGDHVVRLQVTDRDGAVAVAQATIAVGERPAALLRPFPVVRVTALLTGRGTRIRELVVNAPDGARVQVRCRGRDCPFRSFARSADVQARAARTVHIRRLARYLLRPGTLIEIRVTKRGEVGKYTRFRIRKGKPPVRVDRCLPAGSRRPAPCPS